MLSAMTETVIRKQTTQGCYNVSVAGSELYFASQRHWELRKLITGIFSSHTSASLQPDQGSAPDGQHGQPDVSLAWEEGQAEALPRQRPMYCSSQKRGIYFPVTFLKERG